MTENRTNYLFTKEHEWVLPVEGNKVRLGISDYAAEQLGDIVFVEVPELDSEVSVQEEIATVESVKSASEIYTPVSGKIVSVNEKLENAPETLNQSPFGAGWIAEIVLSDFEELNELMSFEAYQAYVADEKEEE